MTSVIKATMGEAFATVRPLAAPAHMPLPDPQLSAAQQKIAELESALRQSAAQAANLESEVDRALERAHAEGRKAGKAEAESHDRQRLERLGKSLTETQAKVDAALRNTEWLAALVARDCLDKLLARPDFRTEILKGLIRAQMAQIAEDALISIRVSAQDFADEAALSALQKSTDTQRLDVHADPALASGDCLVDLRLGKADIGLTRQWTALGSLLTDLGEREES